MPLPQVMENGNIYFLPGTSYSLTIVWICPLALRVQISDLSENNYPILDPDIFGLK